MIIALILMWFLIIVVALRVFGINDYQESDCTGNCDQGRNCTCKGGCEGCD